MAQELSDRESEVVNLLLEGKSNKMIARSLGISDRTVEFHLKNIYAKHQVSSRTELILLLGNTPGKIESEKLGYSTVDKPGENTENGARSNSWTGWTAFFKGAVSNIGKELGMNVSLNSNARSGASTMTFYESIRACLTKYAEFNGRASRSEFWWFAMFVTLVASALAYLSENAASIFLIAVLLPFLAVGARRLHDIGKSAWWLLFLLAPVAGLVLVGILWAQPPTNPLPEDAPPAR